MTIKKDVDLLEFMLIKIKKYTTGEYYIEGLIFDLERCLNQLTVIEEVWKDNFMNLWSNLEISYAVALSQGLEEDFTEAGKIIVKNTLHDLENMIIGEANKLKNKWMDNYKKNSYNCRVCGFNQGFEPWGKDGETPTFDTCKCCGIQFGREDCNVHDVQEQRTRWLRNDSKWFPANDRPQKWSLEEQLKNIPLEYK